MEKERSDPSHDRVRHLAEMVSMPVDEDRIPALAEALEAVMVAIEAIGPLADAAGPPTAEAYDASWPEGGRR